MRLSSRFLWHVWAAVSVLVLISTLMFGLLTSNQLRAYVEKNIEASLINYAILISGLGGDDKPIDEVRLEEFGQQKGIRITLIGPEGRVYFDNLESAETMDNHGSRPEILEARRDGAGSAKRYSQTLGKPMLYVAIIAHPGNPDSDYIRISVSLHDVDNEVSSLQKGIAVGGLVIAFVFLFIGYFLVLQVSRPILDMTEMSMQVASGDYDRRLSVTRKDELGQLAQALNQLAEGARNRIDELVDGKSRLSTILSGLSEGVIAVDAEQIILHINQAAIELLNLDAMDSHERNAEIGRKLFSLDTIVAAELSQAVSQCFSARMGVKKEIRYQGKVLDTQANLLITESVLDGAIVVINDITEVRRLEKIRTDFVANASHELKTPIAAIKGYVETIQDDQTMPPDTRTEFMARISHQAGRLDNVVQDLLQLSRLESHESLSLFEPLDLLTIVEELFARRKQEADDAGIRFSLDAGKQHLTVKGDAIAISQMITNLLENAFSYTGLDRTGEVKLRLIVDSGDAVIEVSDNGIGISEGEQLRIFERFYRADKARSREKGGTGLGLSIVKNVASIHGGMVEVHSTPGKGSRFRVRIPMLPADYPDAG